MEKCCIPKCIAFPWDWNREPALGQGCPILLLRPTFLQCSVQTLLQHICLWLSNVIQIRSISKELVLYINHMKTIFLMSSFLLHNKSHHTWPETADGQTMLPVMSTTSFTVTHATVSDHSPGLLLLISLSPWWHECDESKQIRGMGHSGSHIWFVFNHLLWTQCLTAVSISFLSCMFCRQCI